MNLETYSFLDSQNKVIDTAVFENTCTESDLENAKVILNAFKYIKVDGRKNYGVGNYWSDEHNKFYPAETFINMYWDFDKEEYIPTITKPNNEDISLGEWVWDYKKGEWYFITPVPEVPEGKPDRWVWDRKENQWVWND